MCFHFAVKQNIVLWFYLASKDCAVIHSFIYLFLSHHSKLWPFTTVETACTNE